MFNRMYFVLIMLVQSFSLFSHADECFEEDLQRFNKIVCNSKSKRSHIVVHLNPDPLKQTITPFVYNLYDSDGAVSTKGAPKWVLKLAEWGHPEPIHFNFMDHAIVSNESGGCGQPHKHCDNGFTYWIQPLEAVQADGKFTAYFIEQDTYFDRVEKGTQYYIGPKYLLVSCTARQ